MGGYTIRSATVAEYPLAYTYIPSLFENGPPTTICFGLANNNQEVVVVGGLKVVSRNRQPAIYLDIATTNNYQLDTSLILLQHLEQRATLHGFKEIFHNRTIENRNELNFLQISGYLIYSELLDFQVSLKDFKQELTRLKRYTTFCEESSFTVSIQPLALDDLISVGPLYQKHFNQTDTLTNVFAESSKKKSLRENDRSLTLKVGEQVSGAVLAYIENETLFVESIIVDHCDYRIMAYGYAQLIRQLEINANLEGVIFNNIRFFCDSSTKPIIKLAKRSGASLVRSGHNLHKRL